MLEMAGRQSYTLSHGKCHTSVTAATTTCILHSYQQVGDQDDEKEVDKDDDNGVSVVVNSFLGAVVTVYAEKRPGKEKEPLLQTDEDNRGTGGEKKDEGLFGSITKLVMFLVCL